MSRHSTHLDDFRCGDRDRERLSEDLERPSLRLRPDFGLSSISRMRRPFNSVSLSVSKAFFMSAIEANSTTL